MFDYYLIAALAVLVLYRPVSRALHSSNLGWICPCSRRKGAEPKADQDKSSIDSDI